MSEPAPRTTTSTDQNSSSRRSKLSKVAFADAATVAFAALRLRRRCSKSVKKPHEVMIAIPEQQLPLVATAQADSETERDIDSEAGRYRREFAPATGSVGPKDARAPEQAITLFAFRLAILEKMAAGVGALTFVWATVVLLGGFSQYVSKTDFWVVTTLLLTEGSRIFFRSNELEWQQANSRSPFTLLEVGSSVARKSSRAVSGIALISSIPGLATAVFIFHRLMNFKRLRVQDVLMQSADLLRRSPITRSSSDERHSPSPSPSPSSAWNRHNEAPRHGLPPVQAASGAAAPVVSSRLNSARRTWSISRLPLLPYSKLLSAKGMATILYIAQLVSALLCLALSVWRLAMRDFLNGFPDKHLRENILSSLYAFYVMACLEAFIFLVERTYWEYKICYQGLFAKVAAGAELNGMCVDTIQSFFYQVYSKSLTGSVFDGLEMDLVSYSMQLLQSNDAKEVLGGSKNLRTFVEENHVFKGDTLRRIGITPGAIDRLVEMLAWHHEDEREIRSNSAAIVTALVSSTRNCSRVIAVSGCLDNLMSLIHCNDDLRRQGKEATPLLVELRCYGLYILKSLARDHVNCLRIGETRGLLIQLVDFIKVPEHGSAEDDYKTMRPSLELLSMLASTAGRSGSILRPAIVNVVAAIPHLRDILRFSPGREKRKYLHELALDVLRDLALDEQAQKVQIGSTGGVISNLMLLFTRKPLCLTRFHRRYGTSTTDPTTTDAAAKEEINLANKAGQVLVRLALHNEENCKRILRTRFQDLNLHASTALLDILHDKETEELGIHAARILRGALKCIPGPLHIEVSRHSEFLLKRIITSSSHDKRIQEAALGLAIALPALSDEEFKNVFETERGGVNRKDLVDCLLTCLRHSPSTTRRPRIRRYALELVFLLLDRDEDFKQCFCAGDFGGVLMAMLDDISDVENFILFSGGMGLTRYDDDMEFLVTRVLEALDVGGG